MMPSFIISVAGNRAVIQAQFLYANAFSADATWGGDMKPVDGDTVIVPRG
jgi:G8 domain